MERKGKDEVRKAKFILWFTYPFRFLDKSLYKSTIETYSMIRTIQDFTTAVLLRLLLPFELKELS